MSVSYEHERARLQDTHWNIIVPPLALQDTQIRTEIPMSDSME